eukprot:SAG11_NODE_5361_length_1582_cov_1.977073_1_plen_131_part_00
MLNLKTRLPLRLQSCARAHVRRRDDSPQDADGAPPGSCAVRGHPLQTMASETAAAISVTSQVQRSRQAAPAAAAAACLLGTTVPGTVTASAAGSLLIVINSNTLDLVPAVHLLKKEKKKTLLYRGINTAR